jgi:hypothetical protein
LNVKPRKTAPWNYFRLKSGFLSIEPIKSF